MDCTKHFARKINAKVGEERYKPGAERSYRVDSSCRDSLIPGDRINYLSDISKTVRSYHARRKELVAICRKAESLKNPLSISLSKNAVIWLLKQSVKLNDFGKKSQQILLKNSIAGLKHTLLTMLILLLPSSQ